MNKIILIVFVIAYLVFLSWYDGWFKSPMTEAEFQTMLGDAAHLLEDEQADILGKQFAGTDDGAEFFMLNLNIYHGDPSQPNRDYQDYGREVIKLLLSRASHPVYSSRGIQNLVGARHAEPWQEVILVRYRSRRDFLNMITSPEYQAIAHSRTAAIKHAEVFPTDPGQINLVSPRLIVFLVLGLIAWLANLVVARK